MEPRKKHPIEKENHLNNPHPCISQGVCIPIHYPCIAKGSFWSCMTLELIFQSIFDTCKWMHPLAYIQIPRIWCLPMSCLAASFWKTCGDLPRNPFTNREYLWIWGMAWYPVILGVLAGPNLWTWLLWTQTQKQGVHCEMFIYVINSWLPK